MEAIQIEWNQALEDYPIRHRLLEVGRISSCKESKVILLKQMEGEFKLILKQILTMSKAQEALIHQYRFQPLIVVKNLSYH